MRKKVNELSPDEVARADKIFNNALVIDALTYGPTLLERNYLSETQNAGVMAHFTVIDHDDNMDQGLKRIANWYEMADENNAVIALRADDFEFAKKQNRPCFIMGSQNPKPFEENLSNVRILHALGLRIMQLAYNSPNYIGTGGAQPDRGVTQFGREVIKEMNRVGMLIDVSHCGDNTVMDAIKYSDMPIAITHANPRALVDHIRNKTDEHMHQLAESGGVIGLTAWAPFCELRKGERPDIEDFLDMLEYVIKLIGIDHVGFGLDLTPHWDWAPEDYYDKFQRLYPDLAPGKVEDRMVDGLHHVTQVKNISRGMVARGYSEEDIIKVLGGNFIKLFTEVWHAND